MANIKITKINDLPLLSNPTEDMYCLVGKEDLHKVPWSAIMGQIGAPYIATTVAGMTDKTRVYVYQGSESGYTSGNWYYWNGSAWTSGGIYNSAAVDTDKTLTQSDKPADSAVVGQQIGSLKESLDDKITQLQKNIGYINVLNPNAIEIDKGFSNIVVNSSHINDDIHDLINYAITDIITVHEGDIINVRAIPFGMGMIMFAKEKNGVVDRVEKIDISGQYDYTFRVEHGEKYIRVQIRARNDYIDDIKKYCMIAINAELSSNYVEFGKIQIKNELQIEELKECYDLNSEMHCKNMWKGKKCAVLGTSLTANGGWTDILKNRFGFEKIYNRGLGGTCVSDFSSYKFDWYYTTTKVYANESIYSEDKDSVFYNSSNPIDGEDVKTISCHYSSDDRINLIPSDVDLVIIDIGTNDHSQSRNFQTNSEYEKWIGDFHQKSKYQESQGAYPYDDKYFIDSICNMVKRIQKRCSGAKIIIWGMLYNINVISVGADNQSYVNYYDRLMPILQALKDTCTMLSVNYVNMFEECGVNIFNVYEYFEDGTHPFKATYSTEKGKYAIANVLTAHIKNIYPKNYAD